jgi:hypothetical protein
MFSCCCSRQRGHQRGENGEFLIFFGFNRRDFGVFLVHYRLLYFGPLTP